MRGTLSPQLSAAKIRISESNAKFIWALPSESIFDEVKDTTYSANATFSEPNNSPARFYTFMYPRFSTLFFKSDRRSSRPEAAHSVLTPIEMEPARDEDCGVDADRRASAGGGFGPQPL